MIVRTAARSVGAGRPARGPLLKAMPRQGSRGIWFIEPVADRFIAPLPQPADATEHLVSHWPGYRMIECLGVVQFQHQAGIWKHRDADVMEGHVAASGHTVRIDPEQACGLQVLAGVAIERDSLPLAAENRPHLEVIGDLAGVAPHVLADIIGVIAVVVGAQVFRVAEADMGIFGPQLQSGIGNAITRLGIKDRQAVLAKRPGSAVRQVSVGATRRDVRGIVDRRAAGEAGKEPGLVAQTPRNSGLVAHLCEAADRRFCKSEGVGAVWPGRIAAGYRGSVVAAVVKTVTKILGAMADLELIIQAIDDLAVEAGRRCHPRCRDQAIGQFGPLHAVEQRRFVVEVIERDRHQIDTGRAQGEVIVDPEIEEGLFDFGGAVQLVVVVKRGAGVLEFDLGVEDDVVGDLIGRQQHQAYHIEAVLPLTIVSGILLRAVLDLAPYMPILSPGTGACATPNRSLLFLFGEAAGASGAGAWAYGPVGLPATVGRPAASD